MAKFVYRAATSFNGYIADENNSIEWLFSVDRGDGPPPSLLDGVGALVTGSTTYEWLLQSANMLAEPATWQTYYGTRPMFVFTTRALPVPAGADVRFVQGPVADHLETIRAAAGGDDVAISSGGELAGQLLDAGALDEITLGIAPVALTGGTPLLPRRLEADRLQLTAFERHGQLLNVTYTVQPTVD
ncbi:dihydrofolate reductase family protein [Kribbella sp. NPDC051586]|uniref:dihydrofolate reductase family protein n=1 Tax=Kribbella sp. NPDC051586 TaxID=3364118 RepID=UPI0037B8A1F2